MRHTYGSRKRRKLHIGVSNGFIVAHILADDKIHDGSIASQLIQQVGEIDSITTDKGYDQTELQQSAYDHLREGGKLNIHPRKNAVSGPKNVNERQPNQHIKTINEEGCVGLEKNIRRATVRVKLKTCSFDTKNYLEMHSMSEMKTLVWLSLLSYAIF